MMKDFFEDLSYVAEELHEGIEKSPVMVVAFYLFAIVGLFIVRNVIFAFRNATEAVEIINGGLSVLIFGVGYALYVYMFVPRRPVLQMLKWITELPVRLRRRKDGSA